MSHAHKYRRLRAKSDLFAIVSIVVTIATLAFIACTVLTIVINGISHFNEAISSDEVIFSLRMSVVTSTISTLICLILSLPCAWALTRTAMPFKRTAETLMELTLSLPYILLGFALLLMFSSDAGKALRDAGFAVVFQPIGIVFAQLIVNLPFTIRMVHTAFDGIDTRMEFVAKTLGASPFTTFRTITIPLCRNTLISAFILTWARGMGEFGATLMLVGVTRMRTETLPRSIYLSISTGNTDTAMATAMIMLLVSMATLVISNVLNKPIEASRVSPIRPLRRRK